jgi:hypothetical protein
MTKKEIQIDIAEWSHNLDYKFLPWSNEKVLQLVINYTNGAFEDAAKAVETESLTKPVHLKEFALVKRRTNQQSISAIELARHIRSLKVKK